jgi:hypothetical protein
MLKTLVHLRLARVLSDPGFGFGGQPLQRE